MCSPEAQSFFIYYFYSVIYKTSQQHKYPTWKTYCILFKIVVLLRTGHISWTLKTEFAGQCFPVLVGRFIPASVDKCTRTSVKSLWCSSLDSKYLLWEFPLGCRSLGLLTDSAGFCKIVASWLVQEGCPWVCDITRVSKEPFCLLQCLLAYLLETSTGTFFRGGKRTECFQRRIIICPLRVHWKIFFRVIIFHWDKRACRILDVVWVLEKSQLVNKLSFLFVVKAYYSQQRIQPDKKLRSGFHFNSPPPLSSPPADFCVCCKGFHFTTSVIPRCNNIVPFIGLFSVA